MERRELVEWIVIIAIIVAWWPRIFLGFDAAWYYALIYYVSPVVLILIFVGRYRKMQAGLEYSQKVMDERHRASGANVLGYPPVPTGERQQPPEETADENGDKA